MTESQDTMGDHINKSQPVQPGEILEISVETDSEAAEAVSELFNRFNGGGYEEDSEAGESGGGGAVIEATGFDDFNQPIDGQFKVVVKTYIKPGERGEAIRRRIEEGLWYLGRIYPIPEPIFTILREEDWAHAWKKFYKPMRIGRRVVLKPSWEEFAPEQDDLVVELDPGMAFGTGLHPTTRLCVAALEEMVQPGDEVLDIGTGSGVLSIVAAKLGASAIVSTDIDPIAVSVTRENVAINGLSLAPDGLIDVRLESVPAGMAGRFRILVANILAEVIAGLFDARYGNIPLLEPLAEDGVMILSGIIEERAFLVEEATVRHGLEIVRREQEGDWLVLFVRRQSQSKGH